VIAHNPVGRDTTGGATISLTRCWSFESVLVSFLSLSSSSPRLFLDSLRESFSFLFHVLLSICCGRIMLFYGSAAAILIAVSCVQATFISFNERIEKYALDRGIGVDLVLGAAHNESRGFQP